MFILATQPSFSMIKMGFPVSDIESFDYLCTEVSYQYVSPQNVSNWMQIYFRPIMFVNTIDCVTSNGLIINNTLRLHITEKLFFHKDKNKQ